MSNENNKSEVSGGIGFFGLLGILFIALKLCGVVTWPWVWVLAPIWIPAAIGVCIMVVILIAFLIVKAKQR